MGLWVQITDKVGKFTKALTIQKQAPPPKSHRIGRMSPQVSPGNSVVRTRILKLTLSQKPNSSIFVACFERDAPREG